MLEKIINIKLILLDVDGILCRGDITYIDNGFEIKTFNIYDGLGIKLAQMAGIKTGVITARKSYALKRRMKELKLDIVYQGNENKYEAYQKIKRKLNIDDKQICYLGDDLHDLPILYKVGFAVTVANAREEVKAVADYITENRGGEGAVREIIELILKKQKKYDKLIESFLEYE